MTPQETEAIQRAIDLAKNIFRDPDITKAGPQGSHRAMLVLQANTSEARAELLDRAFAGDANAERAVGYYAATILMSGEQLPPALAVLVAGMLFERFSDEEKGNPHRLELRNKFIVKVGKELEQFDPTRNRSLHNKPGQESRCSIAAKALASIGMTYDESTVEKVWERYVRNSKA